MATREQTRQTREAKLDELHGKLTDAVEQLVSGEDWAKALSFAARFRSRSFNNVLLIWAQHGAAFEAGHVPDPVPSYVAGYKQWQQLGRQVEKGQTGYQILAPVTGRFASATPADSESWRRLNRGEKPKPGEWPGPAWSGFARRMCGMPPRRRAIRSRSIRSRPCWKATHPTDCGTGSLSRCARPGSRYFGCRTRG